MIHLSRHSHLRPNLDVVSRIAPFPITTMRKGKLDAWNSSRIPCAFGSVALSLVSDSEVGDDANNWNDFGPVSVQLSATILLAGPLGVF